MPDKRGVQLLGQGDIGGGIAGEVRPKLPDLVQQGVMRIALDGRVQPVLQRRFAKRG